MAVGRKLRLRLVLFLVRMWLRWEWAHLYPPEAVRLKRFAALEFVLIFGIGFYLHR
jgi:hypothetical protein